MVGLVLNRYYPSYRLTEEDVNMYLIIFGAGLNGRYFLKNCFNSLSLDYDKVFFYDNEASFWGQQIDGVEVLPYKAFCSLSLEDGISIVLASENWREMLDQCRSLGIDHKVIGTISLSLNPYWRLEDRVFTNYGWTKSRLFHKSIDNYEKPLPWYTYSAIEYLNEFDFSDKMVFEYGSGGSSLFWASKAKNCVSVEHDENWFQFVNERVFDNQRIVLRVTEHEYSNAILEEENDFDIVVIDGKWRDSCASAAVKKIRADGMIILDNADRAEWDDEYRKAVDVINGLGFFQIDFKGIGPCNDYAWVTSLFVSRSNRFKRLKQYSPSVPIGGIRG